MAENGHRNQIPPISQPAPGERPTTPSLRRLREDAGLSQDDVAEAMEVSRQAVSKWEQRNDPGEAWPLLAKVLDVKEPYPAAPFEPRARREWFEHRNQLVRRFRPAVQTIGKGEPPK